jgi:hypothetical protein
MKESKYMGIEVISTHDLIFPIGKSSADDGRFSGGLGRDRPAIIAAYKGALFYRSR